MLTKSALMVSGDKYQNRERGKSRLVVVIVQSMLSSEGLEALSLQPG